MTRGSGKKRVLGVQRKKRLFSEEGHEGFTGALTCELGVKEYVEFGCIETGEVGGAEGSGKGHSRLQSFVPLCISELSIMLDT